jgi:hypothetical protein
VRTRALAASFRATSRCRDLSARARARANAARFFPPVQRASATVPRSFSTRPRGVFLDCDVTDDFARNRGDRARRPRRRRRFPRARVHARRSNLDHRNRELTPLRFRPSLSSPRHVVLPPDIAKLLPKGRLLSEVRSLADTPITSSPSAVVRRRSSRRREIFEAAYFFEVLLAPSSVASAR